MATRDATGLPPALAKAPLRTVRARDVHIYTQPRVQLLRLERGELLHRMADGYFAVVPQDRIGTKWKPTLEGAAAGIAATDFGAGNYVLMGLTAARVHGVLPRAIAYAVVAAPRRRADLHLSDRTATIRFLPREVDQIEAERLTTDMGPCLVTTPERTVLDLAHLPNLGAMESEAWAAIDQLLPRCNEAVFAEIAEKHRLGAALRRIRLHQSRLA